MTHIPTIEQRNIILQHVIDRLLYLPEDESERFIETLNTIFNLYHIDVKIENGIRIYNTNKKITNGTRCII